MWVQFKYPTKKGCGTCQIYIILYIENWKFIDSKVWLIILQYSAGQSMKFHFSCNWPNVCALSAFRYSLLPFYLSFVTLLSWEHFIKFRLLTFQNQRNPIGIVLNKFTNIPIKYLCVHPINHLMRCIHIIIYMRKGSVHTSTFDFFSLFSSI